jgi:hypothetical protein
MYIQVNPPRRSTTSPLTNRSPPSAWSVAWSGVILIVPVLTFYRLFKGKDENLAVLVAILGRVVPSHRQLLYRGLRRRRRHARRGFLVRIRQASAKGCSISVLKTNKNTAAEIPWGPMAISVLDPRATGRVPASIPRSLAHHEGLPLLDH